MSAIAQRRRDPAAEPGPAPLQGPRPRIPEAVRRAFWSSRAVVFLAGVFGVLAIGNNAGYQRFDPGHLTSGGSPLGSLLAAPFARWDSAWYLAIAHAGYTNRSDRTAFFPLYPLMLHAGGWLVGSALVAGILISLGAFLLALVLLHRLAVLEIGEPGADLTVTLIAFSPMAYFFSAVYTESLYLALSVGSLLCARRDRWGWCGLLGGLAAASRSAGVLLLVPAVLLYFLGPRARSGAPPRAGLRRLAPRFPLEWSFAWLALIPAGLGAYILFLAVTTGDGLSPFEVQHLWFRHFTGPWGGIRDGAVAAWDGLRQLIHGPAPPRYFARAGGDPLAVGGASLVLFAFLVAGLVACAGALRRLPVAYGAYALCALAMAVSDPVTPQPLASLPRYELVIFPLFMWMAQALSRRRAPDTTPAALGVLLGLFTVEFATWRFVA